MTKSYAKKPVVIQALQWTGGNLEEIITFTDGPPDVRSEHAGMKWEEYKDLVEKEGLYRLEQRCQEHYDKGYSEGFDDGLSTEE